MRRLPRRRQPYRVESMLLGQLGGRGVHHSSLRRRRKRLRTANGDPVGDEATSPRKECNHHKEELRSCRSGSGDGSWPETAFGAERKEQARIQLVATTKTLTGGSNSMPLCF